MNEINLWSDSRFVRLMIHVMAFIVAVGLPVFIVQKNNQKWIGAWASIKSWMIAAPILFIGAALPKQWPFVLVVFAAIYGSKTFFRMTGMYHRSWFVWLSYAAIALQGYLVFHGHHQLFNLMPMLFFLSLVFIPILRNSATHMVQYVALSLMNFIFFGWGLLHLGRMITWENGIYIALHIVILSEFSESMQLLGNRFMGKGKPISNITTRFTVGGFFFSAALTLLLAFALRGLLPSNQEIYWITTGTVVLFLGRIGSITMSFIRRDLGVKEAGAFIIGRDDLLARLDGLVFVGPAVFYAILYLQGLLG